MFLFLGRTASLLRKEKRPDRSAILAGALLAGVALFVEGFFEYNFGDTEVEMATLLVMAIPFSWAVASEQRAFRSPLSAVSRESGNPVELTMNRGELQSRA